MYALGLFSRKWSHLFLLQAGELAWILTSYKDAVEIKTSYSHKRAYIFLHY